MDTRHLRRIRIVQNLFTYDFRKSSKDLPYREEDATFEIIKNLPKIDGQIREHAKKYPIDKIAKTDLAILRLSIYELTIECNNPAKVIINEAVELAKEFGSEHSFEFVNGVLGAVVKNLKTEI